MIDSLLGQRKADVVRRRSGAGHDSDIVNGRLSEQPARPDAGVRRLRLGIFGATESQLLRVPVVAGLRVRREHVDMVDAGRRWTLVQMVLLHQPGHGGDLGIVIDGEAERILHAQRAPLPEHVVAGPAHRQAERLEPRFHAIEVFFPGNAESDGPDAGGVGLAQYESMMLAILSAAQIDPVLVAGGLVKPDQIDVELPCAFEVRGAKFDMSQLEDVGDILDPTGAHGYPSFLMAMASKSGGLGQTRQPTRRIAMQSIGCPRAVCIARYQRRTIFAAACRPNAARRPPP